MNELRVYHSLGEAAHEFGPCVLSIGNFDGVHVGHRRLLKRVAAIAREHGWKASVLTFDPHPTRVVAPERAPALLTQPEERAAAMAGTGITQVLILPFNEQVARLEPEEFVESILVRQLGVRAIVVGANFRFGRRQHGDIAMLTALGRKFGYSVEVVEGVTLRRRMASSSELRRLIRAGDVSRAGRMLTRPFALTGSVVAGRGVGSKQTVPTLNLATDAEVLPATGVYVTRTEDVDEAGRVWPSVTNVGYRPTFDGDERRLTIETFLLAGLVGDTPRRIRVEFLYRLREERKFASAEELKQQILRDVGRAQKWFRRMEEWRMVKQPSR